MGARKKEYEEDRGREGREGVKGEGEGGLVHDDFAEDEFEDGVAHALENELDVLR